MILSTIYDLYNRNSRLSHDYENKQGFVESDAEISLKIDTRLLYIKHWSKILLNSIASHTNYKLLQLAIFSKKTRTLRNRAKMQLHRRKPRSSNAWRWILFPRLNSKALGVSCQLSPSLESWNRCGQKSIGETYRKLNRAAFELPSMHVLRVAAHVEWFFGKSNVELWTCHSGN